MTPPETLAEARKLGGLTLAQMGAALGYRGSKHVRSVQVCAMEAGRKPISPMVSRLATMFLRYGVPTDFLDGGAHDAD